MRRHCSTPRASDHCHDHDLQTTNVTDFVSEFDLLVVSWEIEKSNLLEKNKFALVSHNREGRDYKQLLDEVFVISRIIKVEVRVISRSRRLRLITLTETLIILDITKTESNNCFIIH